MKAILVIEMPEACADGCPVMCRARGINHRPTWCPLKPMPSFKAVDLSDTRDVVMFCHGWNTCLEELLNTGLNYSKEGEELEK